MTGTALVTGAGVRLGRSFALQLAELGYNIAIHFNQSQAAAEATAEGVRQFGVQCDCFQSDFRQETSFDQLIATVRDRFPDLNILINSASVYAAAPISQTTPELFDQQFKINLRSPFFLLKAFALGCESGQIINLLDNKIGFNQYHYAAYLLSKKALAELTKMAAIEFAPRIRVNGIAPGVTLPPPGRAPDYMNWRIQGIPLQQQGKIDYLLQALRYILDNDFVTGQILVVDGGESLTNVGRNSENYLLSQPNHNE